MIASTTNTREPTGSPVRRVALYARVSSDEQREKQTILTQRDVLDRAVLDAGGAVRVVGRFFDDGVSGTVRFERRPEGFRLLDACRQGLVDEVWLTKVDRLGRTIRVIAEAHETIEELGVAVKGILDPMESKLIVNVLGALAEEGRRSFLETTRYGMDRAAREGRYCGGIVPFGYRVAGAKPSARLAPDEGELWGGKSAAEVVRWMYQMLGVEHVSCVAIAERLNAYGVPTHYMRDGRLVGNERKGQRKHATAGVWRPGRVRALLSNPTYRGELAYGKRNPNRSARHVPREVISAECARLVPDELWYAAQAALVSNRLPCVTETRRHYLLKSRMTCAECGTLFCGNWHTRDNKVWYRCGGKQPFRSRLAGKCPGKMIDGDWLEPQILDDITRFLREPGDILDELQSEADAAAPRAQLDEERRTLAARLDELNERRTRLVSLLAREKVDEAEYDRECADLAKERAGVEARLAEITPSEQEEPLAADLREELVRRLDAGLTKDQLYELVSILVKGITVHTEVGEDGKPYARVVVEYRFPGRVADCTGMDSTLPQA